MVEKLAKSLNISIKDLCNKLIENDLQVFEK